MSNICGCHSFIWFLMGGAAGTLIAMLLMLGLYGARDLARQELKKNNLDTSDPLYK